MVVAWEEGMGYTGLVYLHIQKQWGRTRRNDMNGAHRAMIQEQHGFTIKYK
jgi:hypothetical protein